MAIAVVDDVDAAMAHIAAHSTGHSECILTDDAATARRFLTGVDAAAVYHNASTRFTDGGEFGLGCEMVISTQKLHARGPMGLEELCCYKYIVRGQGQIRYKYFQKRLNILPILWYNRFDHVRAPCTRAPFE